MMFFASLTLVLIVDCVARAAEGDSIDVMGLQKKCLEKNGLEEEKVAILKNTTQVETTDERIKCFAKCMLVGVNLMNETGDFTPNGGSEFGKKYKIHYAACTDVTGIDSCDKAHNFQNCIREQLSRQKANSE